AAERCAVGGREADRPTANETTQETTQQTVHPHHLTSGPREMLIFPHVASTRWTPIGSPSSSIYVSQRAYVVPLSGTQSGYFSNHIERWTSRRRNICALSFPRQSAKKAAAGREEHGSSCWAETPPRGRNHSWRMR